MFKNLVLGAMLYNINLQSQPSLIRAQSLREQELRLPGGWTPDPHPPAHTYLG